MLISSLSPGDVVELTKNQLNTEFYWRMRGTVTAVTADFVTVHWRWAGKYTWEENWDQVDLDPHPKDGERWLIIKDTDPTVFGHAEYLDIMLAKEHIANGG